MCGVSENLLFLQPEIAEIRKNSKWNMVIERNIHLQKLIEGKHNGMIKVVTGIRRSGKSFLLFNLFVNHLKEQGVTSNHIIEIDLEDRRNK